MSDSKNKKTGTVKTEPWKSPKGARPPQGKRATRLQTWMMANGISPRELRSAAQGVSRQWFARIRWAKIAHRESDVTLSTMKKMLRGARNLKGPHVQMSDLFDLEPEAEPGPRADADTQPST